MPLLRPDPTFYPSPKMAMQSPPEKLAYMALINPRKTGAPDAIGVVDIDPDSKSYGRLIGQTDMPHADDELHHFGWNACSSCLCPYAPHPHMERRYLVVPGIESSRIHILDTKPDPRNPKIVKVIEADALAQRAGYAAPHMVHCGPDGIYLSALGAPGGDGPGGTFVLDPDTFDIRGRWEIERGPQQLAYDVWWHLGFDTMVTSAWGTPNMVKDGVNPELLLGGKPGTLSTYGTCAAGGTCRNYIWARSSKWSSSFGQRTIQPARMDSQAWSSRSKTCRRRSGCGTGRRTGEAQTDPMESSRSGK